MAHCIHKCLTLLKNLQLNYHTWFEILLKPGSKIHKCNGTKAILIPVAHKTNAVPEV